MPRHWFKPTFSTILKRAFFSSKTRYEIPIRYILAFNRAHGKIIIWLKIIFILPYLGNTYFVSSTLQVLFGIPSFITHLERAYNQVSDLLVAIWISMKENKKKKLSVMVIYSKFDTSVWQIVTVLSSLQWNNQNSSHDGM